MKLPKSGMHFFLERETASNLHKEPLKLERGFKRAWRSQPTLLKSIPTTSKNSSPASKGGVQVNLNYSLPISS